MDECWLSESAHALIVRARSDTGSEGTSGRTVQQSLRLAFAEADAEDSDGDEVEDALFERALGELKANAAAAASMSSARTGAAAASRRTLSGSGNLDNEPAKTK